MLFSQSLLAENADGFEIEGVKFHALLSEVSDMALREGAKMTTRVCENSSYSLISLVDSRSRAASLVHQGSAIALQMITYEIDSGMQELVQHREGYLNHEEARGMLDDVNHLNFTVMVNMASCYQAYLSHHNSPRSS